jgi:hypothetical protein
MPNLRRGLLLAGCILLSASFFSARAQVPPALRVSDNHHYFVTQDGTPFFYLADTEWAMFHMTREDIDLYLKDRAGKKFNVIQAVATFWGGPKLDGPNAYGQTVFVNGDFARPNDEYFKTVDYAVNKANSLGIYVAIVPIWGKGYVNEKGSVFDTTSAFNYGKFLGGRYRDNRVMFILGGDWYPVGTEDIWRAMAAGIAAGDGGTHLKTYHPTGIQSSSNWFQNDAWLDFNMVQSRHMVQNRTYDLIATDWERTPPKPVVEGESEYEGIVDELIAYAPGVPIIQAQDVRRAAYCSVFAGAAGYAYGSQGVWSYSSPIPGAAGRGPAGRGAAGRGARGGSGYGLPAISFQDAMQRPAGSQMQYLRALIESRPMLTRVPDEWLVVNDPLSTTDRIQACRSSDGSYIFVYTSSGKPVRVRLRDKIFDKLSGKAYKAYWYDPRKGTSTLIGQFPRTEPGDRPADVRRNDISREFTPPSSGPGNDWVLVLDDADRNFLPPGTKAQR